MFLHILAIDAFCRSERQLAQIHFFGMILIGRRWVATNGEVEGRDMTGLPSSAPDERASMGFKTSGAHYESFASMGGDSVRMKVHYLQVSPDDLLQLKAKLDGKKEQLEENVQDEQRDE